MVLTKNKVPGGALKGWRLYFALAVGCLIFSAFAGYRIQQQIQDFLPDDPESLRSRRATSDLPPLPTLVANTTFFSLPESERAVAPLRDIDRQQYTIRILSWKRAQFLAASVALHSQCAGVKQIQVVWSVLQEDDNGEKVSMEGGMPNNKIPQEVIDNPKVVIEKRTTNRLNNRFDIQSTTPTETLGIVIIDDDLIYTCDALDMGFFLWAQDPDRMVTYAPRRHAIANKVTNQWRYAWYKNNEYSLGLTSTAFLHRDYLYYYTHYLPRAMYQHIQDNMNCEDIAMSLLVSNLTNGRMPLSIDEWGIHGRTQLALKTGYEGIKSSANNHMAHRSGCVDWYATELGLKDKFKEYATLHRISTTNVEEVHPTIASNKRFQALEAKRNEWFQMPPKEFTSNVVTKMRRDLNEYAAGRNLATEGHGR